VIFSGGGARIAKSETCCILRRPDRWQRPFKSDAHEDVIYIAAPIISRRK
jgi:hypothetical protein